MQTQIPCDCSLPMLYIFHPLNIPLPSPPLPNRIHAEHVLNIHLILSATDEIFSFAFIATAQEPHLYISSIYMPLCRRMTLFGHVPDYKQDKYTYMWVVVVEVVVTTFSSFHCN